MAVKAVRGMHDLLGKELAAWRWVEEKTRAVLAAFGYEEIRTPVLEHLEVFTQGVGDATDIVEKQMYQVAQRGPHSEDTLVLRPEATSSVVRAVIEHQLNREPSPRRLFYYLPMFRHERPQKGRLRQFHQFGAELIQDPSPEADCESIVLLDAVFQAIGLTGYDIRVNSVGSEKSRPQYREKLKAYFQPHLSELCEQCQKRFERAPMRILDCKNEVCQKLVAKAPKMIDHLDTESLEHHRQVKKRLTQAGVKFLEDTSIVRGLDYYSRTAFEFTSNDLGAQSALGGGGRYDELATRFGAPAFPAVGWALGMERVMIALEAQNRLPQVSSNSTFYFAPLGGAAFDWLFPLSMKLKRAGVAVEMAYEKDKKLKWQLKQADRSGASYAVLLGDDEIQKGEVLIKDMKQGTQQTVPLTTLEAHCRKAGQE